jgi:hypothetical protein
VTLLLPLLAACGVPPAGAPVPVEGGASELAALAGSWTGRYWSDRGQGKGHGTIVFHLEPGADTARGQVEMTFAPALHLYGESGDEQELARRPCTAIDIAVVRLESGTIRGTLAPYWSPACDCRVVTVFEGTRDDERITGTFVTRGEAGGAVLATGRWRVDR